MFNSSDEQWRRWRLALYDTLVPRQRVAPCPDGSWDSRSGHSISRGRAATTFLCEMTTEIEYRFQRAKDNLSKPKRWPLIERRGEE